MYLRNSRLVLMACIAAALAGCAQVQDKSWRLFSTKLDAILIINNQLLHGSVVLIPDRTGTVAFNADKGPITSCFGSIRYTATNAGRVDVHCNDGAAAVLPYTLLGETRGYGYGSTDAGPASLVFGLSNQDAKSYLAIPTGKMLVELPDGGFALQ